MTCRREILTLKLYRLHFNKGYGGYAWGDSTTGLPLYEELLAPWQDTLEFTWERGAKQFRFGDLVAVSDRWIVSKNARELLMQNRCKGISFHPVKIVATGGRCPKQRKVYKEMWVSHAVEASYQRSTVSNSTRDYFDVLEGVEALEAVFDVEKAEGRYVGNVTPEQYLIAEYFGAGWPPSDLTIPS